VTRTVSFATLGCRLNQVDSQDLQARLEARGFRTVPLEEPADVVVVNSCAVTARAELSDRQAIRRAGRVNPGARVVVTGCWAQTDPAAAAAAGGDLVVGTADRDRLPDLVEALLADAARGVHVSPLADPAPLRLGPLAPAPGRSRAFLKVQDGCQHRCAFCIVPLARGASRSAPPADVVERVRALVAAGHAEVTLTGVDLGHYGAGLAPRPTLAGLLRALEGIPGLRWVRLSSLLPAYVTPDLVEVLAGSPVVAPHLHLPLQSGSDRVLRAMRRPYSVAMYRALVERLAARIPDLGLGADLIAGFPGETDADFEATVRLVETLPFSYLHVFPYSARPGTEAAPRAPVPSATVTRRAERLRRLGHARNLAFRRRLVGSVREALVLETRDRATGGLVALTDNYVEVTFTGSSDLMRRLVAVRVTGAEPAATHGALAGEAAA
jgi:threonylcarbamoyladenosine tRNA methylthiotransferase MtaB